MKDTGLGMTPEVAARAGEPFFTTKPQGEGTGLGLAQVYGVMKQSGGDLRIESEPGRGTTIDLSLIRTAPELPKDSAKRPLMQPSFATTKSALILLIDDDDEVRIAMAELFRCEGHEVVEASNGQAGLDILVSTRPSVAVIDYLMPGLNGVQVALMAREQMPDLPIVFVSGYSDTAALEGVSGAKVLRKPVNADELLAEVAEYAIF
jgi:CheY-like chemotaxis protein